MLFPSLALSRPPQDGLRAASRRLRSSLEAHREQQRHANLQLFVMSLRQDVAQYFGYVNLDDDCCFVLTFTCECAVQESNHLAKKFALALTESELDPASKASNRERAKRILRARSAPLLPHGSQGPPPGSLPLGSLGPAARRADNLGSELQICWPL